MRNARNNLHHDVAMAGMYSVIEILPPETFAKETKDSVCFDIYYRLKGMLEAYDAQRGVQAINVEPSEN